MLTSLIPNKPPTVIVIETSGTLSGISSDEKDHSILLQADNQVAGDILVSLQQSNKRIVGLTYYIHEAETHFFRRRRLEPREKSKRLIPECSAYKRVFYYQPIRLKYLILGIFLLFQTSLPGQIDIYDLEETFWLNKNDEYIYFGRMGELSASINLHKIMNDEFIEFHMISDTIAFRSLNEYSLNEDNPGYTVKLTVQERSDTSLFLNVACLEKERTHQRQIIKLYKSIANQNIEQFQLKSISLNRSGESLLIDSIGNIKITKSWAIDIPIRYNNESEFGHYSGKLSELQLSNIKESLFRIGILDGLELNNFKYCSHCQEKTLVIEYNDSSLVFKYDWPKVFLIPFLKEISNCCNIEKLNKVE